VLRQTPDLKPEGGWRPEERLSLEQALSGFSATAAWTAGREDRLGSLKPGNLADLTVFEKDLSVVPPEEWADVGVQMTAINGEIVFQKGPKRRTTAPHPGGCRMFQNFRAPFRGLPLLAGGFSPRQ
jgi:predicted amidohydrolase YtcJ